MKQGQSQEWRKGKGVSFPERKHGSKFCKPLSLSEGKYLNSKQKPDTDISPQDVFKRKAVRGCIGKGQLSCERRDLVVEEAQHIPRKTG